MTVPTFHFSVVKDRAHVAPLRGTGSWNRTNMQRVRAVCLTFGLSRYIRCGSGENRTLTDGLRIHCSTFELLTLGGPPGSRTQITRLKRTVL